MSRLTKDLKTPHDDTTYSDVVVNAIDRENIVLTKLKHYEDLEEELGCPLDVVFKALIDGFYFKKKSKTIFTVGDLGLQYDPNLEKNVFALLITYEDSVLVKDYGKTWWLKGDKE